MNAPPNVDLPEVGKTIVIDGLDINYHDVGEGPVLLLIHGSGPGVTAWANWRLSIPSLARHARVIAPDMAGFGYTVVHGDAVPDRALWLRQLAGLLDALDVKEVSIVGNSFGGAMALAFAREYPSRVRDLVLMGPVGVTFPITAGLDKVWGYEPSHAAMRELLQVFVYNTASITDDLVEMRYRASIRADVQQRFATLFPSPRQRWVNALASEQEDLQKITNRTLVIHGREDKVIPLAASERLCDLMPNARLLVIERCGHWVQIEHPEAFGSAVTDFLFGTAFPRGETAD